MSKSLGMALVTGASSGIGAVYADRLAKRRYNLVLVARDQPKLEALAVRLRAGSGIQVEVLPADLSDADDIRRVETRLRGEDIVMLVNNAGMAVPGPLVAADTDSLEAMLRLNIVAATRLARAVAPGLIARGRGDIINIASVTGLMGDKPGVSVSYSATKAYLLAFSEGLESELGPHGVRVQAVLPGVTRTEIWAKGGLDVNAIPAERIMETDDMVEAALAGLDLGERVTIPALPDTTDWEAFKAARAALYPNLSRSQPAERYR